MKRFLLIIILFCVPFIVILVPYLITDPFKVIYDYDVYAENGKPMYVNINRGYVSTQMYKQNKDKYHYDSFIFGSSRSGFYKINDWKPYLSDSASCFHFDGYGESLYQVYKKIQYIDGKSPINNVLLCVDEQLLSNVTPMYTHLHYLSPCLNNNNDVLSFQFAAFRAYLTPSFFVGYLDFKLSGRVKSYMIEQQIIDTTTYIYDMVGNEAGKADVKGLNDSAYYTPQKRALFYERPTQQQYYSKCIIGEEQQRLLREIKTIFDKNHTNYKIIINPVYDQKKFQEADMAILRSIFGERLYDFSGINEYTNDYHNYNDLSHFKSYIAADIIKTIYQ